MTKQYQLRDKKSFLQKLYDSTTYRRALESAGCEQDRKRVAAFATGLVGEFADALVPLVERAMTDPNFVHELREAMTSKHQLVTTGAPVSGTLGSTNG